jgi:hypothetical protein
MMRSHRSTGNAALTLPALALVILMDSLIKRSKIERLLAA